MKGDFPLFDDVGSFPLPEYIQIDKFNQFYWHAYNGIVNKMNIYENRGIYNYFIHPIIQSFQLKLNAGVEVINYPQHMDMHEQFQKPIEEHEIKPNLIDEKWAVIPEIIVLDNFLKNFSEKFGKAPELKICATGPIELYIKKFGFTIYKDMAMNYAKSINRFLKNSFKLIKNSTISVVSLDEPSFGYVDIYNLDDDDIIDILDKSVEGIDSTVQIHLHTLNKYKLILNSKNINVLTCEFASNKNNIIPKKDLESYDKFIRVGIARTNINSIIAEKIDLGENIQNLNTFEGNMSLIDSKDEIKRNLLLALEHYDDRLLFIGPDCGLKGWKPPQVAQELLNRIYSVIKEVKKNYT